MACEMGRGKDHYSGEVENGMAHGRGEMKYASGGVYIGQFVEGKRSGTGSMKFVDNADHSDGDTYDGDWENDFMHGKGMMKFANGNVYDGKWGKGKENGTGTFKWVDGNEYVGEFKDGNRNGKGMMKFDDGDVYDGEWGKGKRNGAGTFKWADGREYVGEWKDSNRNGKGMMKFASGNVYDGEWGKGEYNGAGTYKWADGSEYVGEWKDGNRNGKGMMKFASGNVYDGEWTDDERNGAGTLREMNGDMSKQVYNQGKLVSNKRCVSSEDITPIRGSTSHPSHTHDVVGVILLNEKDTECQCCRNEFLTNTDTEDDNTKMRLPVIGSCSHVFCYGCVLSQQMARAEVKGGRVPKGSIVWTVGKSLHFTQMSLRLIAV